MTSAAIDADDLGCMRGLVQREIDNIERHRRVAGVRTRAADRKIVHAYLRQLQRLATQVEEEPLPPPPVIVHPASVTVHFPFDAATALNNALTREIEMAERKRAAGQEVGLDEYIRRLDVCVRTLAAAWSEAFPK